MTMTKEELVELIKQTIIDLKKEKKVAELDEAIENENDLHEEVIDNLEQEKQDVEAGVIQNSEPSKIQNKCDSVQNECGDKKTEAKNAEESDKSEVTDEVKEEVTEEIQEGKEEGKTEEKIEKEVKEEVAEEKDDEKKEEVIKLEALNSTPKTEGIDIVKNFAPKQTSAKGYAITTVIR